MSQFCKNTYDWQRAVAMSLVPLAIVLIYFAIDRSYGVFVLTMLIGSFVLLWSINVYLNTRATLEISSDNHLLVRRWFRTTDVAPETVRKVVHVFNGRSPDFKLKRTEGLPVYVASSRIYAGHSTLFTWLRDKCPDAEYDSGSIKTRDTLEQESLI